MKNASKLPLYVIAGIGKTGVSVARYCQSKNWSFALTDTRENPPGVDEIKSFAPDVVCHFSGLNEALLLSADVIVLSPGLSLQEPAVARARAQGIKVLGDIELFVQATRVPIIAITGSNGKSTVTMLTQHLLQAAGKKALVGGNIGTPALDLLSQPAPDFYVLELSSFQLETTHSLRAAAATVLNISEDHIDRHGTIAAYAEAKARIYHRAAVAVINGDDPETEREARTALRRTEFSLHKPRAPYGMDQFNGRRWLTVNGQQLIELQRLPIFGEHNAANVLAAVALCEAVGVKAGQVRAALETFTGLPHRCVLVREHNGVRYYNDSKATNVGAALAAINGLGPVIDNKLVLIAGGDAKGQDLTPMTAALTRYVRSVILLGKDAEKLAAIIPSTIAVVHVSNIEAAVQEAARSAVSGDAVLLSPACASIDMFRDYVERGERFSQAVEALP